MWKYHQNLQYDLRSRDAQLRDLHARYNRAKFARNKNVMREIAYKIKIVGCSTNPIHC